jgi:hypothetical protein
VRVQRATWTDGKQYHIITIRLRPKAVFDVPPFRAIYKDQAAAPPPLKGTTDPVPFMQYDAATDSYTAYNTVGVTFQPLHYKWMGAGGAYGVVYLGGKNATGFGSKSRFSEGLIGPDTPASALPFDPENFPTGGWPASFGIVRLFIPVGLNALASAKALMDALGQLRDAPTGTTLSNIVLDPPPPQNTENLKKAALLRAYMPKALYDNIPPAKLNDAAFLDAEIKARQLEAELPHLALVSPVGGYTTVVRRGRWRKMIADIAQGPSTKPANGLYFGTWSFDYDGAMDSPGAFDTIIAMLRSGPKCANKRVEDGLGFRGASVYDDQVSGGGQVCTLRFMGSSVASQPPSGGQTGGVGAYAGITLIISPLLLDRLDLMYYEFDAYGSFHIGHNYGASYARQQSLEGAMAGMATSKYGNSAEIVVPWGVATDYLVACNCNGSKGPEAYRYLVRALLTKGITQINGIPTESFVCAERTSLDLFKKRVAPALGMTTYVKPTTA